MKKVSQGIQECNRPFLPSVPGLPPLQGECSLLSWLGYNCCWCANGQGHTTSGQQTLCRLLVQGKIAHWLWQDKRFLVGGAPLLGLVVLEGWVHERMPGWGKGSWRILAMALTSTELAWQKSKKNSFHQHFHSQTEFLQVLAPPAQP